MHSAAWFVYSLPRIRHCCCCSAHAVQYSPSQAQTRPGSDITQPIISKKALRRHIYTTVHRLPMLLFCCKGSSEPAYCKQHSSTATQHQLMVMQDDMGLSWQAAVAAAQAAACAWYTQQAKQHTTTPVLGARHAQQDRPATYRTHFKRMSKVALSLQLQHTVHCQPPTQ